MVPPAKKLEDLIHLAELCVDLLQQNEEHYAEVSTIDIVSISFTCGLLFYYFQLLTNFNFLFQLTVNIQSIRIIFDRTPKRLKTVLVTSFFSIKTIKIRITFQPFAFDLKLSIEKEKQLLVLRFSFCDHIQ